MKHSDHGIVKNEKAEDQPADKERAQTAHRTDPNKSVSHEATRDPEHAGKKRPDFRRYARNSSINDR